MVRRIFSSRRRARLAAALALLLAVAVVLLLMFRTRSEPSTGSPGRPTNGSGATVVQRRDLVETDTESGTLSYAEPQTVFNRLSGTITWLPRVGQVIRPGQALYRIDGVPVLLMHGSTPAYRDLNASDSDGADIEQLNRDLVALGFNADGIVVDDQWQPATTVGVDLLQASLGETETGRLPLGRIVFLSGDQLVSTLDASVGSTGSGGGSSTAAANATNASTPLTVHPEFVGLTSTTATSATTTTPTTTTRYAKPSTTEAHKRPANAAKPKQPKKATAGSGPRTGNSPRLLPGLTALLKVEVAQLKAATAALRAAKSSSSGAGRSSASSSSSRSSASKASDGGGSATAILQTSSTRLIVTVDLSASSQSEVALGEAVTVEMPAGNTVAGTITAVSPVAQPPSTSANAGAAGGGGSGSGTSSSTVPVTITLKGRHRGPGLDQAAVSVNLAQAKAKHVLSVPVTALIATSGGNYAVQEATAPYTLIPVTAGLFAAGYVQISGAAIHVGLPVTDSQG